MEIKTIEKEVSTLNIVEKSKFITYLFPCNSKDKAQSILEDIRKQYVDATHVCYAFIINEAQSIYYKSSDDGEPSSTAGAPILNALKRNELTNVICIVIRYFGGIKLGAGGLTRTYGNAALSAIEIASIVVLKEAYLYELTMEYEQLKEMDRFLKANQIEIINKEYALKVTYTLLTFEKQQFLNTLQKIAYLPIELKEKKQILAQKKI